MEINFGLPNPLFRQHFAPVADYTAQLTPRELDAVRGAVPQRVHGFSSGRHCAKTALRPFGPATTEILRGAHQQPLWPDGFVGSISHSPTLAGAVVARRPEVAALGLDIEELGRVQPAMWDMLFTAREQAYLSRQPAEEQAYLTTLFFSMKESFYKLQFPLTTCRLWFTDVAIQPSAQGFRLELLKGLPGQVRLPRWTEMHAARTSTQVISLCVWTA